ncbi:MAG: hypothetical protein M3R04_08080 [bacterium]|nr:hypothetical protein [bacterium]
MANSRFAQLMADKLKDTKSLAAMVPGNSRLDVGTHNVTIAAIDTSDPTGDSIKLTFGNADGESTQTNAFLLNKDGTGLSITASQLLAAFVVDRNNYVPFLDWAGEDPKAWECFTGLACVIDIVRSKKGYETKVDGLGNFAAYDIASGEKLTEDFATVAEARDAAKASGFKPSYANVWTIKSPKDPAANAAIVAQILSDRK